ncbi:hypothetical protein pipiens_012208 [Culex pipiens pipiens]|uniref:Uncharacterized protein n=1 Tax=Culex pipiens pipiens TaxID=38569 RepID=A0ABD1D3C3_CULPP
MQDRQLKAPNRGLFCAYSNRPGTSKPESHRLRTVCGNNKMAVKMRARIARDSQDFNAAGIRANGRGSCRGQRQQGGR